MQRERRNNPYPWTWELPAGIACAVLLVLAIGVHVGNGLAHLINGQGWTWPHQSQLFASIPTVLAGSGATGTFGVHAWIVSVELLLIGGLGWAAVTSWQHCGPSRLKGVATRDEAEQVLGVSRLKHVAPVVRPDLHRPRRTPWGRR